MSIIVSEDFTSYADTTALKAAFASHMLGDDLSKCSLDTVIKYLGRNTCRIGDGGFEYFDPYYSLGHIVNGLWARTIYRIDPIAVSFQAFETLLDDPAENTQVETGLSWNNTTPGLWKLQGSAQTPPDGFSVSGVTSYSVAFGQTGNWHEYISLLEKTGALSFRGRIWLDRALIEDLTGSFSLGEILQDLIQMSFEFGSGDGANIALFEAYDKAIDADPYSLLGTTSSHTRRISKRILRSS
jgi:hypothetical protein